MNTSFDYEGARQAGYSDDEIIQHLSQKYSNFDFQGAVKAGYSPPEIIEHLSSKKEKKPKERTFGEKAARIAGQGLLGTVELGTLGYDIPAIAATELFEHFREGMSPAKEELYGELDKLLEKKESGQFTPEDQQRFDQLQGIAQKLTGEKKPLPDITVAGLIEKATGIDTHPEGILEKAARWTSFLKNPRKGWDVLKNWFHDPKDIIKPLKEVIPGTKALRGITAGTALQMAEEGEFGPIGTISSAVIGDVIGGGLPGLAKAGKQILQEPKKTLANIAAKFSKTDQNALQKNIIEDFRKSGIQADLGSITDSNIIKWVQAKLAQSGLTGKSFEESKTNLTKQIKAEYEGLAHELGMQNFASEFEAGEAIQRTVKNIREADLEIIRDIYKKAGESLNERSFVNSNRIMGLLKNIRKELKPGALKSGEQSAVLDVLDRLEKDMVDSEGRVIPAKVKDLMNNKIALNDIINFEVQGGQKQLLKSLVKEIDRAIISHGKDNVDFARNYIKENKKFSEHAKTFRNKNINQVLTTQDPGQLLKKMDSVQGIRDLGKVLNKTQGGKDLFNKLKRTKLENAIGKNMINGSTNQIKLGTFSNLLDSKNNRDLFKEILSKRSYQRLQFIQKNAGILSDAANKFYNASQSGATAVDAAIIGKGMTAFAQAIGGNPWPLMKIGSMIIGARQLSNLMTDPKFLKLVEEAIINHGKGNTKKTFELFEQMGPYILPAMHTIQESSLRSSGESP